MRSFAAAAGLAALLLALPAPAVAAPATGWSGRPLAEALAELGRAGLRLLYTSNVVRPEMVVVVEPRAAAPRERLAELLAPHGLTVEEGVGGTLVVVRPPARLPTAAEAGQVAAPAATFAERVVVTPSRVALVDDRQAAAFELDRDELDALPHLGDDAFRSLALLPGVVANDVSAAFHVRGARRDETEIVLDGQELFDAFHLHDYDDAMSSVAPGVLAGAELLTGSFPAEYGGRMSGVLDLTTREPRGAPRLRVGLGALGVQVAGGGAFAAERGSWLAELRRGTFDLVGRLLDAETPVSWDGFGKLRWALDERSSARAAVLRADDRLDYAARDGTDTKLYRTVYTANHAWMGADRLFGSRLLVDLAAGAADIHRDRRGAESEEDGAFAIRDERQTRVRELRQSAIAAVGGRHQLEAGGRWRRSRTEYDYAAVLALDDPLAELRPDRGVIDRQFVDRLRRDETGIYLLDRWRAAERLTLDLGLRWDRRQDDGPPRWSPRLAGAWRLGARDVVRAAWGRFDQAQRTYELQIEDGETRLLPLERSVHRTVGWERRLGGDGARPLALRVEVYRRSVANPRPRFENLFEPLNVFPEAEPVRVAVAPSESRAEGLEIWLRGEPRPGMRWGVAYARARSRDRIDGRWTPRLYDQRDALTLDVETSLPRGWKLGAAWRWHSGWPTTAIALEERVEAGDGTTLVPVLGPINGRRLRPYHRLDLRLSRDWSRRGWELGTFLEVQNVYDRANASGFDLATDEANGTLVVTPERWPGVLLSAGVTLELGRRTPAIR